MQILLDTSALVAALYKKDPRHSQAITQIEQLQRDRLLVPAPVVIEFFFVAYARLNHYVQVVSLLTLIRSSYKIIALIPEDYVRVEQIMLKYKDARFDFTDAAIMALSERLKITRVFTFDRRDFTLFIPAHAAHLDLLP